MDVRISYAKGKASLRFGPAPDQTVYFTCDHPDHDRPQVDDFAAFACIILAHKFATHVTLHGTVTETTLRNCVYISEFFRRIEYRDTPYEVLPEKVVPDQKPTGQLRSLCLSGGIDSTYALLRHQERLAFTHALVVHGADYRPKHKAGFERLYKRIVAMSEIAGLNPVVVRTNLRKIDYPWGMFHIFQLAACMHFLGPKFSDAAFAADNTVAQDLARFPWGNNSALGTHLGGGTTTVHYLGQNTIRYDKIKAIQADGRFLSHIGVCAANKDAGGNCGVCSKCVLTRLAFEAEQGACPQIFKAMPDLVAHLKQMTRRGSKLKSRGIPLRANEVLLRVTDPDLRKSIIQLREEALRRQRREQKWKNSLLYHVKKRLALMMGQRKS